MIRRAWDIFLKVESYQITFVAGALCGIVFEAALIVAAMTGHAVGAAVFSRVLG